MWKGNKNKMKKKIIIITAIVAVAGAGAGGFLFWDNAYQLNGEKSTGKEGYYADFDLFNGKDEFELQLEQGEKLHVDAEIEKGKAEITFGLKYADVCERISDIESVDTVFTADESGRGPRPLCRRGTTYASFSMLGGRILQVAWLRYRW